MSEPAEAVQEALGAAAQSLRDAAKWFVAGVVGTAAGVFTGSSLTSFGSLDPGEDRFALAVGGLALGFAGLALITGFAIGVLMRDSVTFRELASDPPPRALRKVRPQLEKRYEVRLRLQGVTSLAAYVKRSDELRSRGKGDIEADSFYARAAVDNDIIQADAAFLLVRRRFRCLVAALVVGTPITLAGFGLFAWAANPPEPEEVEAFGLPWL